MKTIKKLATVALLIAMIPGMGSAEEVKKETRKVLNPWVDCGIGAMLFSETTWAAVTSNIIWDLGTTAVTSDYSSQNTCNSKKAQTAMYISATYANLEEETVKGDGQHVHAMLNMMGCNTSAHDEIIGSIRTSFNQSVSDAAYADKTVVSKAQEYYNLVNAKIAAGYSEQCQVL